MYYYLLYLLALFDLGKINFFNSTILLPREDIAASQARFIVENNLKGGFASMYYKNSTYPYASIEDYAEYNNGSLIFLLADISTTSKNLLLNPYGSFSITPDNCSVVNYNNMSYDPLACPRLTLVGRFNQCQNLVNTSDPYFLSFHKKHPAALSWINSNVHQFNLWTMDIHYIYYIGGYGNLHYIGNIPVDTYFKANPINSKFNSA